MNILTALSPLRNTPAVTKPSFYQAQSPIPQKQDTFTPMFRGGNTEEADAIARLTVPAERWADPKGGPTDRVHYISGVFPSEKGADNQAKIAHVLESIGAESIDQALIAKAYPKFVRLVDEHGRFYSGDWTVNNQRKAESKIAGVLKRSLATKPETREKGLKEFFILMEAAKLEGGKWLHLVSDPHNVNQELVTLATAFSNKYRAALPENFKQIEVTGWVSSQGFEIPGIGWSY